MIVTSPGTVSGLVISFDTGFFARSEPPPPPPPTPPSSVQNRNTGASGPGTTTGSNSSPVNEQGAGAGSAADPGGAGGGDRWVTTTTVDGQDRGGLLQMDERGPVPVASWFSTGPESQPTHWKQTLLWLRPCDRAAMALDVGDAVAGRLTLDRNEINPRELGLTVTWTATRQSTGEMFGGTQAYAVC